MNISVAIDGPAAAGKSTIAKRVASILNYTYIDTGAMYRAYTWYCLEHGIDCNDEEASCAVIPDVKIEFGEGNKVFCNGNDVTFAIREPRININVSPIATYKRVRLALVELQRQMARNTSVIMDGRDIGTYVLPDAQVKIFQIASVETRALRRYKENQEKGIPGTLDEIRADVIRRDYVDSHRAFAPLKPAEDSIELDTSDLTIDQVVDAVLKIIDNKLKELKNE